MRHVTQRKRFRDDPKIQLRRGRHIEELIAVVELLAADGALPAAYRPHRLTGDWKGVWECHIEPDWLLIYEVTETEVLLIRTGSHADLFDNR
jgi:mRNA interferase YafQ